VHIIHPVLGRYLEKITPERDQVLAQMEESAAKTQFPIIGPLVGRVLAQLTIMSGAKRILELGSGFGYSAYWFAKAVGKDGSVICTESDPRNRQRAMAFFRKGRILQRVDFRVGNALDIIDDLKGKFDIILIDIDKVDYPQAFRKALPRLRRRGLLIADNLLWSGRVVDKDPDPSTRGILEFTKLVYESPDLLTTIIPLRDGISVSLKI
jgi:caffeoyl-CoA O-methyltransferase